MLHYVLFFIFGAIALAAALNLLFQKHPINSALSLIVVMAALALLYLLLGAPFVAAIQIIVYAGAIMVLFVFTIMLLNAGEEERTKGSRIALMFGVPAVAVAIGLVAYTLAGARSQERVELGGFAPQREFNFPADDRTHKPAQSAATTVPARDAHAENPRDVSKLLFTKYLLAFEVTSVLVLIAIMGAVVLARREDLIGGRDNFAAFGSSRRRASDARENRELVGAGKGERQ